MGLVAEYEITCDALPFTDVAASLPGATLEIDIQYNHGDRPPFIVHVTDDPDASVEEVFASSPFVAEYTLVGRAGETRRYKTLPAVGENAQLGEHLDLSGLRSLATTEAIIERIRVTETGWIQSGWFTDRTTIDAFRTFWQDNGEFSLQRLTRDGEPERPGDGLTDLQHEALRVAYEMGYFDIPRRASLTDIAAELAIAPSSLSERLRRAQTHLLETTVAVPWPPVAESNG